MASSLKAYIFDVENNTGPRAVVSPNEQQTVVGAVAKLDGRASFDTADVPSGILNYTWTFLRTPIGSQVEVEGFSFLDPDDAVVSFAPDITGLYQISLVVDDGSIDSPPFIADVDVSVIAVPNNQGIIPDAKFIWNYLSDFWSLVVDREKFEVVWSAAIQVASAELLKLYQYDYNKSIADIQRFLQKRWLNYDSYLELDRLQVTGLLADDQAGVEGASNIIDSETGIVIEDQPDFFNLVTIPLIEGSFVQASYGRPIALGRLIQIAEQAFTMARSSNGSKATNEGLDGVTVIASDAFLGSGFVVEDIGQVLVIPTGEDAGRYLIDSVFSDSVIHVTDFADPPVAISFLAAASDLAYSIVPRVDNVSNFFADVKDIPTDTIGQAWRFSPTITTTEFDLEQEGVSPGDVIEVEVKRTDLNLTGILRCQVVGSDRGAVSFVFNLDDLEDGIASTGISEAAQEDLADKLQVTGLARDINGILQYTLEAEVVKSVLTSVVFRRNYFETSLTPETEIDLIAFKVKLRPLRIIRNSKILVDQDIVSVPALQEYIRQPDLATLDDQLQVVGRNGKLHPIDHTPYVLAENLDYVIDDESTIIGFANTIQNVDIIDVPRGDMIDRSVRPGDVLELRTGSTVQIFTIRKVLTPEQLRVFPTPVATEHSIQFVLRRKIEGKFIRFVTGGFTKDNPAPPKLWAELTYFSNDPNIEANFGVLVGVRRGDVDSTFVSAPYRSVVEGLMFALTNGPIHENLRLAAQILLGLPFAQNAGVVIEINPEWRIREDGSPLFARMLVEARDPSGTPIGVTNIYLIPRGRQLDDPDNPGEFVPATPNEAGIATNPATGERYVVGDTVEKFAVLSKGVEIEDYLSDPTSTQTFVEQGDVSALLTQYHTFQLKINADVTTPADVDVATSFIRNAKPAYTNILAGLLRVIEDFVEIDDALIFGRELEFFENVSLGLPVAVKLDQGSGDDDFLTVEGNMYALYLRGVDLVTTQGSNQVTTAAGGFILPQATQSHDSPFIRSGDLVIIPEGSNAGNYDVGTVDSDTAVTVINAGVFETGTDQLFNVYRPTKNSIFQGTFGVTQGSPIVTAPAGIFSAGVAVGDTFTFHGGGVDASRKYLITSVSPSIPEITVTPSPVEATSGYTGNVRRGGLEQRYFGHAPADQPHVASYAIGSNAVVFTAGSSDLDTLAFLRPGDSIEADANPGVDYSVIDFDETTLTAYVLPAPDFTAALDPTRASRLYRPLVPVPIDLLDQVPEDSLVLEPRLTTLPVGSIGPAFVYPTVSTQDLTTTAASTDVSTVSGEDFSALGILPGDYLVILAGADSAIDIGYGAGVFPIQEFVSPTTLRLTRPLTVTNGAPGIRYGIQRRDSL